MAFDMRVTLDENEVLAELKESFGIIEVLSKLEISEKTLLDQFYFSEILAIAIEKNQAGVESDIMDSCLDFVIQAKVYDPISNDSAKEFFKDSFLTRNNPESFLRSLRDAAAEYGWVLSFTKTI